MAPVVWWIGTKITGGFLSVGVQVLIGGSVYLIVLFLLHDSFLFEVVGQKVLGGVLAKVKKKFSR